MNFFPNPETLPYFPPPSPVAANQREKKRTRPLPRKLLHRVATTLGVAPAVEAKLSRWICLATPSPRLILHNTRALLLDSDSEFYLRSRELKGFFRGWVLTLLGYSVQGAYKFGFYEFFKKYYFDIAGPEYATK